jgi:hypothetical protein
VRNKSLLQLVHDGSSSEMGTEQHEVMLRRSIVAAARSRFNYTPVNDARR